MLTDKLWTAYRSSSSRGCCHLQSDLGETARHIRRSEECGSSVHFRRDQYGIYCVGWCHPWSDRWQGGFVSALWPCARSDSGGEPSWRGILLSDVRRSENSCYIGEG